MSEVRLSAAAVDWLAGGERGISSLAIFDWLLLRRVDTKWGAGWPRDPDDFRRCELLLREVPEMRARLDEMATRGPEWAALVTHWDELVALLESEVPFIFERGARMKASAPKTYFRMVQLEREAESAA